MAGKYTGFDAMARKAKKTGAKGAKAAPHTVPPGGKMGPGAWMLSPDQRDRNSAHSIEQWRRRGRPIVPRNSDQRNV